MPPVVAGWEASRPSAGVPRADCAVESLDERMVFHCCAIQFSACARPPVGIACAATPRHAQVTQRRPHVPDPTTADVPVPACTSGVPYDDDVVV